MPLIRLDRGDSTQRFGNVMRWGSGSGEGVLVEGGRHGVGKKIGGDVLQQRRKERRRRQRRRQRWQQWQLQGRGLKLKIGINGSVDKN